MFFSTSTEDLLRQGMLTLNLLSISSIIATTSDAAQGGASLNGAVAQLGERLNGIQEVRGSIPLGSTKSIAFALRS